MSKNKNTFENMLHTEKHDFLNEIECNLGKIRILYFRATQAMTEEEKNALTMCSIKNVYELLKSLDDVGLLDWYKKQDPKDIEDTPKK